MVAYLYAVGDHSTAEMLDHWTGNRQDFVCATLYSRASKYMGLPTQCGLYKSVVHECDRKTVQVVRVSELCQENLIQYLERLNERESVIAKVRKWDNSQTICDSLYRLANGQERAVKQGTKRPRDVCVQFSIPHACDGHKTTSHIEAEFRDTFNSYCSSMGYDATGQDEICSNFRQEILKWQEEKKQPIMCCVVPHTCDGNKRLRPVQPEFRDAFDSYCNSLGFHIEEIDSICYNFRRRITKWTQKQPRGPVKHEFQTRSTRSVAPVKVVSTAKQEASIAQELERMMKVRFFDLQKYSDDQVANILTDIVHGFVKDPERQFQLVARSQALLT